MLRKVFQYRYRKKSKTYKSVFSPFYSLSTNMYLRATLYEPNIKKEQKNPKHRQRHTLKSYAYYLI